MASANLDVPSQREAHGVINDKPGRRKGIMSSFQINSDSAYSTMIAASMFGSIVEKSHWQLVVHIVILAHNLKWWYAGSFDPRCDHLYISNVQRSMALSYLPASLMLFEEDNARPHVEQLKTCDQWLPSDWQATTHHSKLPINWHGVEVTCISVPVRTMYVWLHGQADKYCWLWQRWLFLVLYVGSVCILIPCVFSHLFFPL